MYDPRLNEKKSEFDWPLFGATIGLMLIGTAFIYSVTAGRVPQVAWYRQEYVRQIIWYVLGLGAAVAFCTVEYARIARWAAVYYWGSIVVLVALFAIGTMHRGV
jgi:cell division protein FtsW (lipid II flippase)